MKQPQRIASGGRIDRAAPLSFTFDGETYQGFKGDTLASALLANDIHLVGRSFKYHRPRGILTAGSEEPNALVGLRRDEGQNTPNLRATQIELYSGLDAVSQNRFPSLSFDIGAVNDLLSPLFAAGFYYKTFMWPQSFWNKVYEPFIRAAAGLGNAPRDADRDRYANTYAHCDVLVIGSGPAGLAAATAAAESGARVILCDEQREMGGSLLHENDPSVAISSEPAGQWVEKTLADLAANDRVTLLPRTTAFGYFAQNFVALAERVTDHLADPDPRLPRERLWQVRAKQVVIATGAIERPMVFPENDRPGIMMAEAGRIYLNRYGAKVGSRVVIATACDTAYHAAIDLKQAGIEVDLVADLRPDPQGAAIDAAKAAGIRVEPAMVVTGTQGRKRVSKALLGRVRPDGSVVSAGSIACDCLLMSGGWTPNVSLYSQSRGKVVFDEASGAFVPGPSVQAERSAGSCRGINGLAAVIEDGFEAGEVAAKAAIGKGKRPEAPEVSGGEAGSGGTLGALPHDRDAARVRAFVDFQNDVTAKDVKLAVREGFQSIEHIKRYTTTGMATDQGRLSNMNALSIASTALDRTIPDVGLTTFRQPYTPVTFGTLATTSRGDLFDPVRQTPIHGWAEEQGAAFEDVGLWKRAWYFPKPGEGMHEAVARECATVRETVGLFDASTLGKIEVVGPDAAEFLNRIYTNPWLKLGVGKLRYGLMLNEAGFIMDDGVVGRIAEDRFHVTTTTGGAPRVLAHMEDYLQTEWPDLDVWLTSTTEQWAVIAVQGPKAREAIAPLVEGIDLAPEAMPHMSMQTGTICGVPTRLFRVSFTGELGFEINVPASKGREVWEAVWERVKALEGCAYGTETMHVLRAEKGYIIVGQETDGTVTPDDVGMDWAIGKKKADFVGMRSLARPDIVVSGRKQLVGLLTDNPSVVLEEGAQVTQEARPALKTSALGHVTSSYHSPALGRSIALALVADGRAKTGSTLYVPMPDGPIAVEVVSPVFYDPQGARLDV
ncbi:sarcosine oxidase subunit alpha family protein [Stappia sp. F7233]|uniref:Sarcosine oxidase subunit alpha family protein n=1 Tax=Stappia albiluteola TaxID=2758565 RepID=A0A839AE60_9HYPH|nr:sarcosine oxidase subunit alpha family protein [Stappia albiluteola]MBA5776879.1 sarcosine oxidase subunit alpha family protein [Stappia albiluteola]